MTLSLAYAKRIAYSSEETLNFTHRMAMKFRSIDGCYVECGCAAGAQVIAMADAAPRKRIWAFDSFQGIPLPSNRDDQMPGIEFLTPTQQKMLPNPGEQKLISSGATSVSLPDFYNHLKNAGVFGAGIIPVEGWFEETIPKADYINKIVILRLDGDLYNSTWVCLQHLFPKVIQGGCVIIDDWELPGCRSACEEYFALIGYMPDYKFISNISYFYK